MESIAAIPACSKAAAQAIRSRREPLGIKSLLALPLGYRMLHAILGTHRMRRHYVDGFVKPAPGSRVIDIGCGTADILNYLPAVNYFGVDYNAHYIDHNVAGFRARNFTSQT